MDGKDTPWSAERRAVPRGSKSVGLGKVCPVVPNSRWAQPCSWIRILAFGSAIPKLGAKRAWVPLVITSWMNSRRKRSRPAYSEQAERAGDKRRLMVRGR